MKNYTPVMSFDETVAKYDRTFLRGDEEAAVAFLADLAGDGPALELAIGTGRIAVPLAARGVRVDGIDLSEPMIAQLRTRPGGENIPVTVGDFAGVPVEGTYRLIYVVFNTMFNLLTQEDQVRCFQNVAAHLESGGAFVIEAGSPAALYGLRDDQYVNAEAVEVNYVRFDLLRHDPVTQTLDESHVTISATGVHFAPVRQRYAWPPELDLMARIAGLRLRERWGYWDRTPYAANSPTVISVYEHAEAGR